MYNNCILTNVPSYRIIDEVQREKVCEREGEEEEVERRWRRKRRWRRYSFV